MNIFSALQEHFQQTSEITVLIFQQILWKENISVYRQLRVLQKAVTVEISVTCLPAGVCHHSWWSCHPCSPSRSAPHSGQSWDKQGSAGPVPTNPAPSRGNSLRMMHRICPQLLPEGGAVAGEKLFPSQTWKKISVHSTRLMIDALHNINCNSNH